MDDIITHVDGAPVDEWSRKAYTGAVEGEQDELKLRVLRAGEVIEVPLLTGGRARWLIGLTRESDNPHGGLVARVVR